MKTKLQNINLSLYFLLLTISNRVFGSDSDSFKLSNAPSGLIDHNDFVKNSFITAEYAVKGVAALFSVTCFIQSASYARSGRYANCVAALVGGVISGAAYLLTSKVLQG